MPQRWPPQIRNDGSIRRRRSAARSVRESEVHDPLHRCREPYGHGYSSSTRRDEHGQQPGAEHAQPGAGLGLAVGRDNGRPGRSGRAGRSPRPPGGAPRRTAAAARRPRRCTVASTAPWRRRRCAWMPPLQLVVQRVEAERHARGEPFPVPDQQRVGEAGHVPRRPVAVPGAVRELDAAGVSERSARPRPAARRPRAGRRPRRAGRAGGSSTPLSARRPRRVPQQPAMSRIAAASRRRGQRRARAATPAAPTGPAPRAAPLSDVQRLGHGQLW